MGAFSPTGAFSAFLPPHLLSAGRKNVPAYQSRDIPFVIASFPFFHVQQVLLPGPNPVAVGIHPAHVLVKAQRHIRGGEPDPLGFHRQLVGFQRLEKLPAIAPADGLRDQERRHDLRFRPAVRQADAALLGGLLVLAAKAEPVDSAADVVHAERVSLPVPVVVRVASSPV